MRCMSAISQIRRSGHRAAECDVSDGTEEQSYSCDLHWHDTRLNVPLEHPLHGIADTQGRRCGSPQSVLMRKKTSSLYLDSFATSSTGRRYCGRQTVLGRISPIIQTAKHVYGNVVIRAFRKSFGSSVD